MLNDRIVEFQGLEEYILMKIKSNKRKFKLMICSRVRCDFYKIDTHRASYSERKERKKHSENIQQNKIFVLRRNPIKRIVKEDNKVSDTKFDNLFYFTNRGKKVAYDIIIDNHHDKHANSKITITSKVNTTGIEVILNNKTITEMSNLYAKFLNQYIFKYLLTVLVIFN